jgi:methyltransferase (TIGR00027 family)
MRDDQPSRTAEYMALFRALENVRPAHERLFSDPLARAFLGARLRLVADLARVPLVARLACDLIDRRWPGVRTSAVARTRFIDDRVVTAVSEGAQQVVILGAGFDARAYRLAALRQRVVFEVDHPSTQARKRRLLEAAIGRVPQNVRFVPTDFAEHRLEADIAAAGYDPERRSLVLWEGVTNYLMASAVDATLRWCASAAAGSEILFTYVDAEVLRNPGAYVGTATLFEKLAAAGERWTFGLDPRATSGYLRERGLALLEDVGASQYRAICYGPAAAGMRGYEFYRVALARVVA